ncbi:SKI family transcriptional corepressor 2 [Schistosoma japonicum]|nr:SKI family transcriptional corepressor 2 [Schistosoma japonicum]
MDLTVYSTQFNLSSISPGLKSSTSQEVNLDYSSNWAKAYVDHSKNSMKKELKKVQKVHNPYYSNCMSDIHQCDMRNSTKYSHKNGKVSDKLNSLNKSKASFTSNQREVIDSYSYFNALNSLSSDTKLDQVNEELLSNSPYDKQIQHQPYYTKNLYTIKLRDQQLVCLNMDGVKRLCLAQISSTLLKQYSYNEIHNRRVALGITCVQCTSSQLELLREAGAMPASSRRCGTITYREAERLIKSFLDEPQHPKLPENFIFQVVHHCGWGCQGAFSPSRYTSSRAKCIRCCTCQSYFSPNKFIFHCHSPQSNDNNSSKSIYRHPDAANFNAWRRHLFLIDPNPPTEVIHAWEDVKAMFNGGNRKRSPIIHTNHTVLPPTTTITTINNHRSIDDSLLVTNDLVECSDSSLLRGSNSKHIRLHSCTTNWSNATQSNSDSSSSSSSSSDMCGLYKPDKSHEEIVSPALEKKEKTNFMIENVIKRQPINNTNKFQLIKKFKDNLNESHEECPKFTHSFTTDIRNNGTLPGISIPLDEEDFDKTQNYYSVNLSKTVDFDLTKHLNTNSITLTPGSLFRSSQPYVDGGVTGYFLNAWPSLLLFQHLMYGSKYPTHLQGPSDSAIHNSFSSGCILNLTNSRVPSTTNQINIQMTSDNPINEISSNSSNISQKDLLLESSLMTSVSASQQINPSTFI